MYCVRKMEDQLYWIGGSDRKISLFENIFSVPKGISYNSYLLLDEKTVLFDTVDHAISRQFLENLEYLLQDRELDYLVINHMEPDHCSLVKDLYVKYPEMKLVCTAKTIQLIQQFFQMDVSGRSITVKEGDTLSTGTHTLQFIMAPMIHWPEVMFTYDQTNKVLFAADAFGTFGALGGNIFDDEITIDGYWMEEARRYYCNIVGKYGSQVQNVLKKLEKIQVSAICPLHGPIWRKNIDLIVEKYKIWSSFEPEQKGVLIAYASMYGNTENTANVLANMLADAGVKDIAMYDVSHTELSCLIAEAFRFSHMIIATPTYNAHIYPVMESFLLDMQALNLQNRTVAVIENGSWAPGALNKILKIFEDMKNMTVLEDSLTVKSSVVEDQMECLKKITERFASEIL